MRKFGVVETFYNSYKDPLTRQTQILLTHFYIQILFLFTMFIINFMEILSKIRRTFISIQKLKTS